MGAVALLSHCVWPGRGSDEGWNIGTVYGNNEVEGGWSSMNAHLKRGGREQVETGGILSAQA